MLLYYSLGSEAGQVSLMAGNIWKKFNCVRTIVVVVSGGGWWVVVGYVNIWVVGSVNSKIGLKQ